MGQIQALIEATQEVRFAGKQRAEMYEWITRTLRQQQYREQGKRAPGLPRRYVGKMTGLSRTQVTRLVGQYLGHGEVKEAAYQRRHFGSRYTRSDIECRLSRRSTMRVSSTDGALIHFGESPAMRYASPVGIAT
ncbi:MAG: hypothetical protein EXQ52_05560 [Bryobacterales bacterium]|nr:hypothetical protein [Bryobacterales bacterium]